MDRIIKIIFTLYILQSITFAKNINSNKIYDVNYLNEIKSQTDSTINPCTNFYQYACGNLNDKVLFELPGAWSDKDPDIEILENYLINIEPKTNAEKNVKDFYLSCKNNPSLKNLFEQIDILKVIGAWPTNREHDKKEIARLMGELTGFSESDLISFYLTEHTLTLEGIRTIKNYPVNVVTIKMMEIGATSEEAKDSIKNVQEFLDKINKIVNELPSESEVASVENITDIENLIPGFEWQEYFKALESYNINLNLLSLNSQKKINNPKHLKKIIDLINETDSKIVVDYLVSKYVKFASKFDCLDVLPYYRPLLLQKLWKEKLTKKENIDKQIEMLEYYQDSLKQMLVLQNDSIIGYVQNSIAEKKYVLSNYTHILTDEFIENFYKSFNIKPNELYSNIINFVNRIIIMAALKNENAFVEDELFKIILGGYDKTIDFNAPDDISILYLFTTQNQQLWNKYFLSNEPYDNYDNVLECLVQINKNGTYYDNRQFLTVYAATKINFNDFNNYLNNLNVTDEEKNELKKLFFTSLVQYKSKIGDSGSNAEIIGVLKRLKEFNDVFECSVGTEMNKSTEKCEINGLCKNPNQLHLLPYDLPNCEV